MYDVLTKRVYDKTAYFVIIHIYIIVGFHICVLSSYHQFASDTCDLITDFLRRLFIGTANEVELGDMNDIG